MFEDSISYSLLHKGYCYLSTAWSIRLLFKVLNMIFSLLKSGAQTILVIGVSPISPSAQMTFDELKREFKTNIKHLRVDIANEEKMRVLDECLDKMPPVAGVINSAGVLDDKEFHNVTRDAYRRVMGPKINGKTFLLPSQEC